MTELTIPVPDVEPGIHQALNRQLERRTQACSGDLCRPPRLLTVGGPA